MEQSLDLNFLLIFAKVAELHSFTAAAVALEIPKSKVSRAISYLEESLQSPVLYRTTRQVELTALGQQLFAQCRPGIEAVQLGLQTILNRQKQLEGSIRITSVEDIGLQIITPLVAKFCEMYPKVKVELIFGLSVLDLVQNSVDVAVRVGKVAPMSHRIRKIGNISFILAASPQYLERFSAPLMPDTLNTCDIIGFSGYGLKKQELLLSRKAEIKKVHIEPKFEASSTAACLQLAMLGQGVALLPDFLCREPFRREQLQPVCRGWHTKTKDISLVLPGRHSKSAMIQIFSDFMFSRLVEEFAS